jgi:FkbH-like protein
VSTVHSLMSTLRRSGVTLWLEQGRLLYRTPNGALAPELISELQARKGEIIDFLDQAHRLTTTAPALTARPRNSTMPLSFAQERLWLLDQLETLGAAYHIPMAMRLRGDLDTAAFERSLAELVNRHEVLRTRIVSVNDVPVQVIDPPGEFRLDVVDLSHVKEDERKGISWRHGADLVGQPFDLSKGPLLRVQLLRLAADEHIAVLVLHHIISDGWSRAVLIRELGALYAAFAEGQPSPLPPLALQYADYALWQREWLQGETLGQLASYWRNKLSGAPPVLELPTDRPRPPVQAFKGATVWFDLPAELTAALGALARAEGATLFMTLLAAFQIALWRWSGQSDMVIGTPIANRTRREIEGLIGFFLNMLALRTEISADFSFRQFLGRVRQTALDGYAHQDLPLEALVEQLQPERNLSRQPIFQVLFALQNTPRETFELAGVELQWLAGEGTTAKFDLSLYFHETAQGLRGQLEYGTALFDRATIDRMIDDIRSVFQQVAGAPDRSVAELRDSIPPLGIEISVSGSFTAEPLFDPLWFWLERVGLTALVKTTGYNQVLQSLFADPPLTRESHQFHVILLRLEDWGRRLRDADQEDSSEGSVTLSVSGIQRNVDEFLTQLRRTTQSGAGHFLVGICPSSPEVMSVPRYALQLELIESQLTQGLTGVPRVEVLPLAATAAALGVKQIHDRHLDKSAQIPYASEYFSAVATAVMRALLAARRHAYKVAVVDCDNTLWSGICGEDGPSGVRVTPGRRRLQEYLVHQVSKGILVCLCSRNNESDVMEVFAQNPDMVLSPEDIVSHRIGWGGKPEALLELAGELDLAVDSFVFLDDDPVECARMEKEHPEVLTLRMPQTDEEIDGLLRCLWAFDGAGSTAEDRQRTRRYREERTRRTVREASSSRREFIAGLELRAELLDARPDDVDRIEQILERTTQFNTTTLRLSAAEVREFLKRTDKRFLILEVSDRFGDYGKSGLLVLDRSEPYWRVECVALSCRVLGRDVEYRIVELLVALLRHDGGEGLVFEFHGTARNRPAYQFFRELLGLAQLPQQVEPRNSIALDQLSAALERRNAWMGESLAAPSEPERPAEPNQPVGPAAAPGSRDLASARGRFYRLAATDYQTADAIVQALRAPSTRLLPVSSRYEAPRSPVEVALASIWSELLGVDRVGIHDNFFAVGGHSLMATRIIGRVRDALRVEMPLRSIFEAPTIAQLAAKLIEQQQMARSALVDDLRQRVASMSPDEVRAMLRQLKAEQET